MLFQGNDFNIAEVPIPVLKNRLERWPVVTEENGMRKTLVIMIVLMWFAMFWSGCGGQPPPVLISGFEKDPDLDRFQWNCRTLFSIAPIHATEGRSALRFEIYPSKYPGFAYHTKKRNWAGFHFFSFDVFNPGPVKTDIHVRIDDGGYRKYGDRYDASFSLVPGLNEIRVPLVPFKTTKTTRTMDIRDVSVIILFFSKPAEKKIFYFDNLRLERS
jgi:hypothetical protein